MARRVGIAVILSAFIPAAFAAKNILVHGDSLSAGYGIRRDAAWPALLASRLKKEGFDYNVVNVSISGETTSGGLTRLPASLKRYRPAIVIIALGSNDGLRGIPLELTRRNLAVMTDAAQKARAKVVIVGQRIPPNFGSYAKQFHEIFGEIARAKKTAHVAFLLDGIAARSELFLPDNLHPAAEAQPYLLNNVWKELKPLLKK